MGQAGEPSVEEILESIKKVIARDNRDEAAALRIRRRDSGLQGALAEAMSAETSADDDEILELTEAEQDASDRTILQHDSIGFDDADDEEATPPLVSEAKRDAMRESLAALAVMAEPAAAPQIVRSGETSLEGLVRDMLRPMLAEWLDKNLPGMVDEMVAREIARIVGKRD